MTISEAIRPGDTIDHDVARPRRSPQVLILSAADVDDLADTCLAWSDVLEPDGEGTFAGLVRSAAVPAPEEPRVGLVAASPAEAAVLLCAAASALRGMPEALSWRDPRGIHYRARALCPPVVVVAPSCQTNAVRQLQDAAAQLRVAGIALEPLDPTPVVLTAAN